MAIRESGGNTGLAFIVGALMVVVLIIAGLMFYGGGLPGMADTRDVNIDVTAPSLPTGEG